MNIQLTLVTSNTDISKYPLISKNIVKMCFLFFFTFEVLLAQTSGSQSKFSRIRNYSEISSLI